MYKEHLFYFLFFIHSVFTFAQDTLSPPVVILSAACPKPITTIARNPTIIPLAVLKNNKGEAIKNEKGNPFILGEAGGYTYMQNYSSSEGLYSAVNVICKDKSGMLWFGTDGGGVFRYDGKSFTNFTTAHGLTNNVIRCITEDKNGNLWFGTFGGGACRYNGKSFTNFTKAQGLANSVVWSIFEDKNGNLWFGTEGNKVSKYNGKSFNNFIIIPGFDDNEIFSIAEDKNGNLWFGTEHGVVSRYDGKSFTIFTAAPELVDYAVRCIAKDNNENLWFGTDGRGVFRYDGKFITNFTTAQGLVDNAVRCIAEDINGNLWFGTEGGGVSRYDGKSFTNFTTAQGLSNKSVRCITKDNNGNLWFGTYGGGVCRYNDKSFTNFTTAQGLAGNAVRCIAEDINGNLWFGTYGNGVSQYNGISFTNFTKTQGLGNNFIWDIIKDKNGNLWFGTSGRGANRYDGKSFTNFTSSQGLVNNTVLSITEDKKGNLWFGTYGGGVSRYDGKSFANFTTSQGLVNNTVLSIAEDKKGNLWFGTYGGGVSQYDGKSFTNFTTSQGLANNFVSSITEDKNGNLWFGTENGLNYLVISKSYLSSKALHKKNENIKLFKTYTTANGLSDNYITKIIKDKEDIMYFGTNWGFSRLIDWKKENNDSVPIFETFNKRTGYPVQDVNSGNNTMFQDSKGIIWVATGDDKTALVRFDPSALKKNPNPPTVMIQSIKINEEKICWYDLSQKPLEGSRKIATSISGFRSSDSTTLVQQEMITYGKNLISEELLTFRKKFAGIQFDSIARFYPIPEKLILPYKHNHVTFDFTAIEPAKPYLVNYQYFMEGYDKEWMPITKNTSATYGNINEGNYSFMIKAQSPDGVWSEPVIYKFTVLPPWYRHPAALVGYIILFIIVLIVSVRLYTMRLRAQKKRLEQIVKDRTKEIQAKNIQLESTNIVIAQKNKDITDSINYARRIQLAIMEEKEVIYSQIPNSFILYLPRDIVSGDFYYYNKINEDETILAVCDCTGHGVPGAFMSMIGNDQLNYAIIEKKITTPSKILDQLHEGIRFALHQNKETSMVRDGMDLSLCKINIKKKELEYAGAHRPLWILRNGKLLSNNTHSENGDTSALLDEIKADKFPIGGYQSEENRIFTNNKVFLNSGDTMYMFTDGYLDQFGGPKKKKLTTKRFREKILEIQKLPINEQEKTLSEYFYDWKGEDEQIDDVMVIGVRF